mmetsp:Transcript_68299/g.193485  ORF Transcript_68299/g.193485 Transcript_68299/m.193485 type:complete len:339 (+) Transcript_68299:71-1087(+)
MHNYQTGQPSTATPRQYGSCGAPGPVVDDTAPLGYSQADLWANDVPLERKRPFVQGKRQRLNLLAMFLCLFLPWILFVIVFALLSFSAHYNQPGLVYTIVVLIGLAILIQGRLALYFQEQGSIGMAVRGASWAVFLFVSFLIAFCLAVVLGCLNYRANTWSIYQLVSLNDYQGVDPSRMRGEQLMDAGIVNFAPNATIDVTKSKSFRSLVTYCVAPISMGSDQLMTYDFWAVGIDCCSRTKASFHCGNNKASAHSALRWLKVNDRPYFRLAVQQAEAEYKITATHPLFFEWTEDPHEVIRQLRSNSIQNFLFALFGHLLFQAFIVAVAVMAFSKIGRY